MGLFLERCSTPAQHRCVRASAVGIIDIQTAIYKMSHDLPVTLLSCTDTGWWSLLCMGSHRSWRVATCSVPPNLALDSASNVAGLISRTSPVFSSMHVVVSALQRAQCHFHLICEAAYLRIDLYAELAPL